MARRPLGEPELSEGVRLLDRYVILDRVGSGGMASIYRATDERLDRVVCVKLLRTTLPAADGSGSAVVKATYEHFLREALALSKLQHPNTLRIYDFGYVDEGGHAVEIGAPFQVSEYLDGGNLESLVRLRGCIPPSETVTLLESVTGAVAEAHEAGILHRDIKPSNILFARVRGELVPKLADFGIAHSASADPSRGPSAVALFSPRWAAPEQLCGAAEGPCTDVYALGLLTAFMLSGRVLFDDTDVRATFEARVHGDALVHARVAQLGLPTPIERVLTWAMSSRPAGRLGSAPEMLDALRTSFDAPTLPMRPKVDTAREAAPEAPPESPPPPAPPAPPLPAAGALAIDEADGSSDGASHVAEERALASGPRRVRVVHVHERLDLSFVDEGGAPVRFRVTMLPGGLTLNVKGLTCFVARPGQRPTPALTVTHDGALELVSATRQVLGALTWSFGARSEAGHAFVVDDAPLLVPYSDARHAVVLSSGRDSPSRGRDIVVMCLR